MPIIGAAYLRCSDPRQDKSIDQQRDEITRRAQADGVIIPPENWFIDEGLSGRSAKKRKSYQDLLRRAEAQRDARQGRTRSRIQPIDRLYVWAFSRIARNMFDCLRALATLDEADIDILSLTEPDGGDKSFRKLIRPILAWLAERYSEELSRNVQRGMRSQAERGFWVYGHAPFGYATVPGEGGSRLQVTDDTRAAFETVQRIFADYLKGHDGSKRIAERLTLEGVTPPSREDVPRERLAGTWRAKHVVQILGNPLYAGHIVYDGEIVARDAHPAAISEADFARAAAIGALRDRARKDGQRGGAEPIRTGEHGLLTPWLRCGTCGGRIRVNPGGQPNKRTYLYNCSSRIESTNSCPGISIRVEKLDRLVLDAIESQILTPENLQTLADEARAALVTTPSDPNTEARATLEAQIADLDRRIRQTAAQVVSGLLDESDAIAINTPLRAQREHAKLRLASLPTGTPPPPSSSLDLEAFRTAVLEAWTNRPLEARREALDQLLEQVTLSPGGLHIHYRVTCSGDGYQSHSPFGPPKSPHSLNRAHLAVPVYKVAGRHGPVPSARPLASTVTPVTVPLRGTRLAARGGPRS